MGLLYQKEQEEILLSNSKYGLQAAGNTYQWNLIEGLEETLEDPVYILNSIPVGTYPNYYKQLFITSESWAHKEGAKDEELGFVNVPILKQLIRYFSFCRKVKHWCKKNPKEDLVIIAYSMYLPYLKVLSVMKRRYQYLHTCIIIPDLPNAFGFEQKSNSIKKYFRKMIERFQYKYTKQADAYVLLTKEMEKPLEIKDKLFTVVEGICNPFQLLHEYQEINHSHIILYTGALNQRFGLDTLVNAFQGILDENLQLWICGVGDYQSEIEKAALRDNRIKYFGYVTASTIQKMLLKATILINPRPNEEEYTKYSFPSKTIEYMASGRPVLMYKLDGIPDDYDEYLYYIKENSIESMKESIISITGLSKEELSIKGKGARNFVLEYKNGKVQGQKILDMLYKTISIGKGIIVSDSHIKSIDNETKVTGNNIPVIDKKILDQELKKHNKKMCILQINITCGYGSTGKKVEEIHNFLSDKGIDSFIAYSAFDSRIKESFKIENHFENFVRRGLNRYIGRKYVHSSLGTLRLIKKIKQLCPDVIHLHNIQQNSLDFPRLLKFLHRYGAPVVYTLHDCWAFTGGCYHFTELDCDGYKSGCQECNCKLPKDQRDLCNKTTSVINEEKKNMLFLLNHVRIICVSKWLKSCAEQSFMKDLPLQVIYNGIDINIFKPVESRKREEIGIAKDEFIILGVANHWNNKKGLDIFISLSKILKHPYRIVLVGLPKDSLREEIISVDRTDCIQELVQWYSCADVFLNASKEETFGLAVAEAMACGTPVIAYSSTACGEVVDEESGILLKTNSMDDLLLAIDHIRQKGKAEYSEQCIQNVKSRFLLEDMLLNYLKVYEQMVEDIKINI